MSPSMADIPLEDSAKTSLMSKSSDRASRTSDYIQSARKPRLLAVWWQEAIAAFFLASSAIASFATLYPYQGKPLPDWPYSITIGALLSAYSVILRLTAAFLLAEGLSQLKWQWFNEKERPLHDLVLHDDAARGPLGAISLLKRLPFPRSWQWLACVLVLIALLIGPFTQQVLQYTQCSVLVKRSDARQARVPRASIFVGQGTHDGAAINTLTIAEQATINAGLYTTGQVSADCLTGNCTIAPYKSIGYCSSCLDVSYSDVQVVVVNNTNNLPPFNNTVTTTTSLSSGLFVAYRDSSESSSGSASYDFGTSGFTNYGTNLQILLGMPGSPMDPATRGTPTGCENATSKQTWRCQGYGAANCTFYPCVRSYHGRVQNGEFTETVVDETPPNYPIWNTTVGLVGGYLTYTLDKSCLKDDEHQVLEVAGVKFNASYNWTPYTPFNVTNYDPHYHEPSNVKDLIDLERRITDRGCLYAMDYFFSNGLAIYLKTALNGSLTGSTGNYGRFTAFEGSQLLQLIYNYGNSSFERTESLMNNISLSLSNYMRLTPGQDRYTSSMPATGEAAEMKTCLNVKWVWLALPTAVAILTLVFFGAVMASASKIPRDLRTWKSSPLPLLYYGPHHNVADGAHDSYITRHDVTGMNLRAKDLKVQLLTDDKGAVRLRERNAGDDPI